MVLLVDRFRLWRPVRTLVISQFKVCRTKKYKKRCFPCYVNGKTPNSTENFSELQFWAPLCSGIFLNILGWEPKKIFIFGTTFIYSLTSSLDWLAVLIPQLTESGCDSWQGQAFLMSIHICSFEFGIKYILVVIYV